MKAPCILIVDDESGNRRALSRLLGDLSEQILEASNGLDALELLKQGQHADVIILDLMMPLMDGLEFLRVAKDQELLISPVVVCSANTEISKVVEAMKLGAVDYLEKPIEPQLLHMRVKNLLERQELRRQNLELQRQLKASAKRRLLGNSIPVKNCQMAIERLANSASTVLIHGESGTGKELVARSLHDFSERSAQPFIVVDCAAVHANTIESELFGHERGAYTGADQKREGLLLAAGSGTIFFDEIGELPLDLQAKLLRVLQERQVRSLGSTFYRPLSARVIAATNRDLLQEVKIGHFREDLYYRLEIVQLKLPSLRERKEDVELLVTHFLNKFADEYGTKEFDRQAMDAMLAFDWPGNVRQLENAVHRALAMSNREQDLITLDLLPEEIQQARPNTASSGAGSSENTQSLFPLLSMRELEQQAIVRALEFTKGNRRQACEVLGIGEATLYRKLKEFGIN